MARVIFGKNNLPFSILIRIVTWSRWSHVGILKDGYVYEAAMFKGVVKTPVAEFEARYRKTAIAHLPSEIDMCYVKSQLGKKYDWVAAFGLGIRRVWYSPNRLLCSVYIARATDIWRDSYVPRVTPQDVWEISKDEK